MKILINNKSIRHEASSHVQETSSTDIQKLKEVLSEIIRKKNENGKCDIDWKEDGTAILTSSKTVPLHTFLLKIEELGKNFTCTNQTVITIT